MWKNEKGVCLNCLKLNVFQAKQKSTVSDFFTLRDGKIKQNKTFEIETNKQNMNYKQNISYLRTHNERS